MKTAYIYLISFVACFLAGCVNQTPYSVLPPEIREMMGSEGMYIHSNLRRWATAYEVDPKTGFKKPSRATRAVARTMTDYEDRPHQIEFMGESSKVTCEVILAAVELNKGKNLNKLEFVYIGSVDYKEPIRKAIESLGAKFYFYEFDTQAYYDELERKYKN